MAGVPAENDCNDDVSGEALDCYIPICSDDVKPKLGMRFKSIDEGYAFYQKYALAVGFSVRKSSSRKMRKSDNVHRQHFVCSKEGRKADSKCKDKRKRLLTRVDCPAKIILRYCGRDNIEYEVTMFDEEHTHPLSSPSQSMFTKEGRNVGIFQKKFIFDNAKVFLYPFHYFSLLSMNNCTVIRYNPECYFIFILEFFIFFPSWIDIY